MKNVLAIYGGPRRGRNTEILLDCFIDNLDKEKFCVLKIMLCELKLQPCISCYHCSEGISCSINDDMTMLYKKIEDSDIIVLASPIYFGNVTAYAKAMIDRCQLFWSKKYIAGIRDYKNKKKGYFIATAGSKDAQMLEHAKFTVKLFFAACGALYSGELFALNTDETEVKSNSEILKQAQKIARCIE